MTDVSARMKKGLSAPHLGNAKLLAGRRSLPAAASFAARSMAIVLVVLMSFIGCQTRDTHGSATARRDSETTGLSRSPDATVQPTHVVTSGLHEHEVDACSAVRDVDVLMTAIADNLGLRLPSAEPACMLALIDTLFQRAVDGGSRREFDAFAWLATVIDDEYRTIYEHRCVQLYHRATTATMDYLYYRAIGRHTAMVRRMRGGLATEIGHARDSAARWRAFDAALAAYADGDATGKRRLHAAMLRAGVLRQLAGYTWPDDSGGHDIR